MKSKYKKFFIKVISLALGNVGDIEQVTKCISYILNLYNF